MKRRRPIHSGLVLKGIIAALILFLGLSFALRRHDQPAEAMPEKASPVRTVVVEPVTLHDQVELPARIEADYRALLPVDKGGRITAILVDRGDEVAEGQLLLTIDARTWQAMLDRAEIELREAEKDLRRFEELARAGAVSTSEFDTVRTRYEQAAAVADEARAHVSQCEVRSPGNGFVNDRLVEVGEFAPEGAAVLEVVRTDPVRVVVDVPEREVGSLHPGDPLTFRLNTLGLGSHTATVSFVARAAAAANPSFRTEAKAANPDGVLKPGMLATVTLARGQPRQVIAAPLAAVIPKKGEHFVFVARDDRAVRRLVRIGRFTGEQAVLDDGLAAGDELIVDGHRTLVDGQKIERMAEPDGR